MPAMREVWVQGHKMVALCANEDRTNTPIVLIHGLMANVFIGVSAVPPSLSDALRWYSLSLPGHFPAVFPPGFRPADLGVEEIADVLGGAIRALVGDRPVLLGGHSTGGFAALAVAARAPEMVQGVVSLGGFVQGRCSGGIGMLQWLARHGAAGRALFRMSLKMLTARLPVYRASLRSFAADGRALDSWPLLDATVAASYPYFRQLDVDSMLAYFSRLPDLDIRPLLPQIASPTLVLAGDRDPVVPPAQSRLIAAEAPHSELVLFEGAGHLVPGERPSEYQRVLTAWIEGVVHELYGLTEEQTGIVEGGV